MLTRVFACVSMVSFPSLMTVATRIHKTGLSTLYGEEKDKLREKLTLTEEETGPDIRTYTYIYIMYRYL